MNLATYILTTGRRQCYLDPMLMSFANSDWPSKPAIFTDIGLFKKHGVAISSLEPRVRSALAYKMLLAKYVSSGVPYGLILEDDIIVGRHFWHNVQQIQPYAGLITLWNPGFAIMPGCNMDDFNHTYYTNWKHTHGSMALLFSRFYAQQLLTSWGGKTGNEEDHNPQDLAIYSNCQLAGLDPRAVKQSLVEHIGAVSTISSERKLQVSGNFDINYKI